MKMEQQNLLADDSHSSHSIEDCFGVIKNYRSNLAKDPSEEIKPQINRFKQPSEPIILLETLESPSSLSKNKKVKKLPKTRDEEKPGNTCRFGRRKKQIALRFVSADYQQTDKLIQRYYELWSQEIDHFSKNGETDIATLFLPFKANQMIDQPKPKQKLQKIKKRKQRKIHESDMQDEVNLDNAPNSNYDLLFNLSYNGPSQSLVIQQEKNQFFFFDKDL